MNLYRAFSRWLKAPLYDPVKIPARVTFVRDPELEKRIGIAAAKLPPNSVKAVIAKRAAVDFERLPAG